MMTKIVLATAIGCDVTVIPVLSGLRSEWSVQKHFGAFPNVLQTGSVLATKLVSISILKSIECINTVPGCSLDPD